MDLFNRTFFVCDDFLFILFVRFFFIFGFFFHRIIFAATVGCCEPRAIRQRASFLSTRIIIRVYTHNKSNRSLIPSAPGRPRWQCVRTQDEVLYSVFRPVMRSRTQYFNRITGGRTRIIEKTDLYLMDPMCSDKIILSATTSHSYTSYTHYTVILYLVQYRVRLINVLYYKTVNKSSQQVVPYTYNMNYVYFNIYKKNFFGLDSKRYYCCTYAAASGRPAFFHFSC